MFNFLYDSAYIAARNNNDYFHFGHVKVPMPGWDYVLDELDRELVIQANQKDQNIVKHFQNYSIVIHQAQNIHPVVGDFLKQISNSYTGFKRNQGFTALGYISLSSLSQTYGRHNDVMDVWCWNILGKTKWTVEGRQRVFEKVLEPGELIYVPRGMWHDTTPMGPRVNISFGSEDLR